MGIPLSRETGSLPARPLSSSVRDRPNADVRGCEITLIGLRPNHRLVLALPARGMGSTDGVPDRRGLVPALKALGWPT